MSLGELDENWAAMVPFGTGGRLEPGGPLTVADAVLRLPQLQQVIRKFEISPPADYTGKWTEWFGNGQKLRERSFLNGRAGDEYVVYQSNGAKNEEATVTKGDRGESIQTITSWYYGSGKIAFVETIVDGKRTSRIGWWENGQKRQETAYKEGRKHGLETRWDDAGAVESRVLYENGVAVTPQRK